MIWTPIEKGLPEFKNSEWRYFILNRNDTSSSILKYHYAMVDSIEIFKSQLRLCMTTHYLEIKPPEMIK